VASVLAQQGIAVTMVLRDDHVGAKLFTPAMSEFFERYFQARGVSFVKRAEVKEASGGGSLSRVALNTGKTLECDLMVVGIGVRPETGVLAGSGLEIGDGVMVNEYLETNVAGIYAAGDVANYQDTLFRKRRRVEHWDNAVSQGQHCARTLMGDRQPFVHVPYFFSDVFDLSYEYWGDNSGADDVQVRGDITTNSFSVWWRKQKQLVAAFVMNRPGEERESAPKEISKR